VAGNESAPSTPLSIVIDTIAPAAPDAVDLLPASDTGISNTDNITADNTPSFILPVLAVDETPNLYVDGVKVPAVYDPVTNTLTPVTPLDDGSHNITLTITDVAGNESAPSLALPIVVDIVAPPAPIAMLDPFSDSGVLGDDSTNDKTPTISGNGAVKGDTITVTSPTGEILTAIVAVDGTWRVTPLIPLLVGNLQTFVIIATDPAGNVSPPSKIDVGIVPDSLPIIINNAPAVNNDSVPVTEDMTVKGNVLTNDKDVDHNALTVVGVKVDVNGDGLADSIALGIATPISDKLGHVIGVLTINKNGSFIFEPAHDYNGAVPVVSYTVSDGVGGVAIGSLMLGPVSAVNDAPVATDAKVSVVEDTSFIGNIMSHAVDVDGDKLTVLGARIDINGDGTPDSLTLGIPTLIINKDGQLVGSITVKLDGSVFFAPALNYNGFVPVLTYAIADGNGGVDTGNLDFGSVMPVNDAPVITDAGVLVKENTAFYSNLLVNVIDVDGDKITLSNASIDTNGDGNPDALVLGETTLITDKEGNLIGTIIVKGNGDLTFTPAHNFTGPVPVLIYTVSDGHGGSDTGTLTFGSVVPVTIIDNGSASNTNGDRSEIGSLILLSNPEPPLFPVTTNNTYFTPTKDRPHINTLAENDWFKAPYLSLRDYGNDDLYLAGLLKDRIVIEKQPYRFDIPAGTFKHTNPNENLAYKATLSDGSPLPDWLKFNTKTLAFFGIPPKAGISVEVLVTVTDTSERSVHATFMVRVHKEKYHHSSHDKQHGFDKVKPGLGKQLHAASKVGRMQNGRELLDSLTAEQDVENVTILKIQKG
jgi:hypothetical protein